ncbi:MAG: DUF512 domain-containing protein [Bacillota bacterium]|jgi:putative radical SAM enzyme (TIGR03279 family)
MGQLRGGRIAAVEDQSLGQHLGIKPGDTVISVNGHPLRDELDYRFYVSEENVTIVILSEDGQETVLEIEKDEDDLLGLVFVDPIFDEVKTCSNNCVFCFVRQIPRCMREGLHLRDDDFRMSFIYGNFLSLTNLTQEDWVRIEEQRLSPLRVSVHATDKAIRSCLMGNPEASRIMEHLARLVGAGIRIHVQIVLLRGVNDGPILQRTLDDLDSLGPNLVSVGVVPAVYTRYRKNPPSPPMDSVWAGETLDLLEEYAAAKRPERGDNWVYGADEFYVSAGRCIPSYEYYGDFHQFDNGIGIIADFRRQLEETVKKVETGQAREAETGTALTGSGKRPKSLAVTGEMAYSDVIRAVERLGLSDRVSVCLVPNTFFGPSVTCSGLLTGQDILASVLGFLSNGVKEAREYGLLLIPGVSLFNGLFLDNMTLEDIRDATGLATVLVEPTPEGLIGAVARRGQECQMSS